MNELKKQLQKKLEKLYCQQNSILEHLGLKINKLEVDGC
ncbi:hypothetical protein QF028_002539 [Neobacillus sp. B4I6]